MVPKLYEMLSYYRINAVQMDLKKYRQNPLDDEEKLDELVKFMEEDFIKDLNFCSHDNVSKKVNSEIVEGIYVNMVGVIGMVKEYFGLENK
jgi:hypothetical protein